MTPAIPTLSASVNLIRPSFITVKSYIVTRSCTRQSKTSPPADAQTAIEADTQADMQTESVPDAPSLLQTDIKDFAYPPGHAARTAQPEHSTPSQAGPEECEDWVAELRVSTTDGNTTAQLHMTDCFVSTIVKLLPKDPSFRLIYNKLLLQLQDTANHPDGPSISLSTYSIDPHTKALYFVDGQNMRLAVPDKMRPNLLRMAHDERAHPGRSSQPNLSGLLDDETRSPAGSPRR